MLYLFAVGTSIATLLGGLFALRLKDRLHLILGFSAGAVVGVAFFDLMPEALRLSLPTYDAGTLLACVALGFVLYLTVDRFFALHSHTENDGHTHHRPGFLGAATLSLHSFLDGVGIGLAFKVSPAVGLVVALAVLAHDFSDGINTVQMVVKSGEGRRSAMRWLYVDALAPLAGVLSTLFFTLAPAQLGLLLALFGGFFLYIGASDLLPESHHAHPVYWTTLSTILGIVLMYGVVSLAG
jgi:ZIP family zinc transporter